MSITPKCEKTSVTVGVKYIIYIGSLPWHKNLNYCIFPYPYGFKFQNIFHQQGKSEAFRYDLKFWKMSEDQKATFGKCNDELYFSSNASNIKLGI